ncbi:acryloyl-CoA reductase (plasmid) [Paraburkholderia sp. PREW-6R]|uniref:acrylyl-CoA reductase family protein n=1 Tax=Paraburkholderia sp. PREW-6R TaxID=3141544 RepID=UPI0031F558FC
MNQPHGALSSSLPSVFRAIRVAESDGRAMGAIVDTTLDALDPGDVVIRTAYSGINYKDALAVTGSAPIIRRLPCIAGIEAVGTVVHADDTSVRVGANVIVHGFGLGVDHDGGFAPYVRVPAAWVIPLPDSLTLFEAATIGVAGCTAALAIHRMEHNGLAPGQGPVIVTGATGGVASLGIAMLAAAGYEVAAITGKRDAEPYLRALGASTVLPRSDVEAGGKPLRRGQWAGALDSVGGDTLAWLLSTMRDNAPIAAFGNAGGATFAGNVLPFILRGVQLLGINANSPMPLRRAVWARIANDLRPRHVEAIGKAIAFDDVPAVCARQMKGDIRGRSVVDFSR